MISVRLSVLVAAACARITCLTAADTTVAGPAEASVLERLAALERRYDELAAENRSLREELATARSPGPAVASPTKAEPTKAEKPAVVYAAAAGKEQKLSVGGFFHLNAETGDAPDARWAGVHDRFFVRRARLNVSGSFAEDFAFKLEGDFGNNSVGGRSGYSAQMTDGFATWTPSPMISARIGQFKTPFGFEQLMSDTKVATVERSLPNDRLTLSRQIGSGLFGDLVPGRLAYSVGVFNGNGVNNGDNDNDDFLWVGRINGTLFQGGEGASKFQLDGGVNAFTTKNASTPTRREGLGADLQFTWGPATLMAEWLKNDLTAASGTESTADGWSLLGLWSLTPRWVLMARLENFDPSTSLDLDETDSWTLGGSYLIHGDNIKLTFNYMQGTTDAFGTNSRVLGRLQLAY